MIVKQLLSKLIEVRIITGIRVGLSSATELQKYAARTIAV
ncbi:hypothetical protein Tco_1295613, partial [Tanacetum coccineum]